MTHPVLDHDTIYDTLANAGADTLGQTVLTEVTTAVSNLIRDGHAEPTDADLRDIETRYTEAEVPDCRVCGAELNIASAGGGEPTKYAHGRPDGVSFADWHDHYQRSVWLQHRPGDTQVVALIAEVRRLRGLTSD